jgi:SAM-dependent methyltransferase
MVTCPEPIAAFSIQRKPLVTVKNEQEFFDETYASGIREQAVGQVYSITRERVRNYEDMIYTGVAGLRVLEYGCGTGGHSLEIAQRGGLVTGIDISAVGIAMAAEKAKQLGLPNAEYRVMDAENLEFNDATFDIVIGEGILHHLRLERSYQEIARVLAPGGRAIFMEPLGHNPAINAFRSRTPQLRTADEHPLVKRDLSLARKYFQSCTFHYYHLFSFGALALLKTKLFWPAVAALDRVDRFAFKVFPPLGLLGWYAIMVLEKPRSERPGVVRQASSR